MGVLLGMMGKLEEAMPLLKEALQGRRETQGDRHPDTLASISSMAHQLSREEGKLDEAVSYLEEAVKGYKETLGSNHPRTRSVVNGLTKLMQRRLVRDLAEHMPKPRSALATHRLQELARLVL